AAEALAAEEAAASAAAAQRIVARVIRAVAGQLGNTASICRKSYVHPVVIEDYLNRLHSNGASRTFATHFVSKPRSQNGAALNGQAAAVAATVLRPRSRRAAEASLLAFLRRHLKKLPVPKAV
ncbi:MAG TPA: hypothetical protein VGH32_02695, partial [Pirellulales bacterium]